MHHNKEKYLIEKFGFKEITAKNLFKILGGKQGMDKVVRKKPG